jgi:hypothetical protein
MSIRRKSLPVRPDFTVGRREHLLTGHDLLGLGYGRGAAFDVDAARADWRVHGAELVKFWRQDRSAWLRSNAPGFGNPAPAGGARPWAATALRGRGPVRERDPGDRAVTWINALTHTSGRWAGTPFNLRPWQEQLIRQMFGTLRPDGRRQFRTIYVECGRKNGKSSLTAALALYLLKSPTASGAGRSTARQPTAIKRH